MTITLASIERKIADGRDVEPAEVLWLVRSLRAVTGPDAPVDGVDDDAWPTTDELVAEFGLGADPSPDMVAYLRTFVRERALEEAEERAAGGTD